MRPFPSVVRVASSLLVLACIATVPSPAQEAVVGDAPWQPVITGQIEAFRHHDAPAAFQYAADAFRVRFTSPEAFFVAIIGSGYSPLMTSRSHSFGGFRKLGEKTVLQSVALIGNDLSRYEVLYQLAEEPAGWRVQGVQLIRQPGMAI